MNDIIQNIKDIAHRVSEDYLLTGKDMNGALVQAYQNGEIENEEVLKRICEIANQNVYLSLFNDPSINKANITFHIVDFSNIIPMVRESEKAMSELNTPPNDYRSKGLKNEEDKEGEGHEGEQAEELASNVEKTGNLNTIVQYRDTIKNFIDKVASLRVSEEQSAESAFNQMGHDAKILVGKDESLGDMSKLATVFAKEIGAPRFMKVAEAYDEIDKSLTSNGFKVRTDFTKLSSLKVNHGAEFFRPVKEYILSIEKIAGFNEMEQSARRALDIFNSYIKKVMA